MTELLKPAEVARRLGCSPRTLSEHVRAGALKYVNIGCGRQRQRRMFTEADVEAFIERQTRRDVPCLSTSPRARRSTNTTSSSVVTGFLALRNARMNETRRR